MYYFIVTLLYFILFSSRGVIVIHKLFLTCTVVSVQLVYESALFYEGHVRVNLALKLDIQLVGSIL